MRTQWFAQARIWSVLNRMALRRFGKRRAGALVFLRAHGVQVVDHGLHKLLVVSMDGHQNMRIAREGIIFFRSEETFQVCAEDPSDLYDCFDPRYDLATLDSSHGLMALSNTPAQLSLREACTIAQHSNAPPDPKSFHFHNAFSRAFGNRYRAPNMGYLKNP
jgi:hypothetical protein